MLFRSGRSSVWVHYVPEAEVWRFICEACRAGRPAAPGADKVAVPSSDVDCEACGEKLMSVYAVTSAQFAQTAPRLARGGTFVPVEPERPIDASELAALLPMPEEPAGP